MEGGELLVVVALAIILYLLFDKRKETYKVCSKASDCGDSNDNNTYTCQPECVKGSSWFDCPNVCVHNGEIMSN
jgi:hypothetical protein